MAFEPKWMFRNGAAVLKKREWKLLSLHIVSCIGFWTTFLALIPVVLLCLASKLINYITEHLNSVSWTLVDIPLRPWRRMHNHLRSQYRAKYHGGKL